ncbi:HAMP domain-containing sensor histidine kinase [Brachybacterium sp.]|uniref:sensor histidine kinase n=1 Tax=Brachybacterium sp. TaxID=1891286 RepID=UPI002ED52790
MSTQVLQVSGEQLLALALGAFLLGALAAAGLLALRSRSAPAGPVPPDGADEVVPEKSSARLLSHEIRTPLTLVKGAADLLAEETPGPLSPTQRYFVDTIVDNTSLVVSMAEDFLLEARLESGAPTLDLASVDIRELVRGTVLELRRIRSAAVNLDSRGEPLVLDVDRAMIRQVLWNLLNNAVRHAGPDAEVTVRVEATSEGATIAVADDGEGMDPDRRAELFSPRSSGHPQGTGLGMGVIRRIVDAHGGRVVVDSLVRRGTRILIVLPWPSRDVTDG